MTPQQLLDNNETINELDISHLVIEDDTPVDNFQSEEQQRLLVEPLYSSKVLVSPFLVAANVGVFYKLKGDPIVPDVLLSLGVQRPENYSERRNRSYFVWEFGKVPDVCIEVVSNSEGDELTLSPKSQQKGKKTTKKDIYAQIGVNYYVVFDPLRQIQGKDEMNGAILRVWMISPVGYGELTPVEEITRVEQSVWLQGIGLGLTLWEGEFEEEVRRLWLRWCDREGQVIPTGAEAKEIEQQRAEAERQRAEAERQRAEAERQRAEQAESQLEAERRRVEQLSARLRAMGIDPNQE
jgi:Uma2 family endonuclease